MENNAGVEIYDGNCHCGLFQFQLHIPKLTTVWTCNCSICSRNGYLWIFPVPEKCFVIRSGTEKALHAYEFAMRGTRHLFCPECGSSVLARRREAPAGQSLRINARMLEGVDLAALEVKSFNGADTKTNSQSDELFTAQEVPKGKKQKECHGNCHCGAVRFRLSLPELKEVHRCTCSHCTRKGHLALIVDKLTIDKGEDVLKTYQFGSKAVEHKFCPTCGSYIFGSRHVEPQGYHFSVNARMLKDVDVDSLVKKDFDGGTILGSKYVPPSVPGYEGVVEEGLKIYNGSCHCGAVSYTVKSKPLEEMEIISCNCSLCSRRSDLFIYPLSTDVQVHGTENLTEYFFVSSMHNFCSLCGTSVLVRQLGEEDNQTPINIRTLNGADLKSLKYYYYDGKASGTPYEI